MALAMAKGKVEVAPLVGAWIEMVCLAGAASAAGSLPLWERGLKCKRDLCAPGPVPSLPLWERGLKSVPRPPIYYSFPVAPLVGAWIEIPAVRILLAPESSSLPLWERGLKYPVHRNDSDRLCRSPCGSVD